MPVGIGCFLWHDTLIDAFPRAPENAGFRQMMKYPLQLPGAAMEQGGCLSNFSQPSVGTAEIHPVEQPILQRAPNRFRMGGAAPAFQ